MGSTLISPLTKGGLDAALNALVQNTPGGTAGSADDPRIPFVLSSTLRDRVTNISIRGDGDGINSVSENVQNLTVVSKRLFGANNSGTNSTSSTVSDVTPLLTSTVTDLNSVSSGPVTLEINPNNIEFTQPKRYVAQQTLKGTIFHHFTDNKKYNNDILTIKFRGNTGNIRQIGRTEEDRSRARQRLKVWHNLYQLTREPMILEDNSTNVFSITYCSPLFTLPITFYGFFTSVLNFSETADKPNSRNYSMDFIVQNTNNDLNNLASLIFNANTISADLLPDSTISIA